MSFGRVALGLFAVMAMGRGVPASRAAPVPSPYNDQSFKYEFDGVKLSRATIWRIIPATLPLTLWHVTSGYGLRGDPFFRGFSAFHHGVDLGAPEGTPVYATGAGRVTIAGQESGYGNLVEVTHAFGLSSRYAHLSRIDVIAGQVVDQGALLGLVGHTGDATGPHLHYEIRRDGVPTDPVAFIIAAYKMYHSLD